MVFSVLCRSQTASVHFFGPYAINKEQNTIFFGRLQSHVFRLTPVTAGVGYIGVRALWRKFFTAERSATAVKMQPPGESTSIHTSVHVCKAVRTQHWAIRPDFGLPREGLCMNPRHRLLLVDMVDLKPLPSMRFRLVTSWGNKKKPNPQKKQL